jgi:hypothetical protein
VPRDEQTAVLAGLRGISESVVETIRLDARDGENLRGVFERSPAALRIRRRKICAAGGAGFGQANQAGERQRGKEEFHGKVMSQGFERGKFFNWLRAGKLR